MKGEATRRNEGRDNTADELARMAELDAAQAAIYQPAWEAAMRRMNSSREMRVASSRNSEPEMRLPDGQARVSFKSSVASRPSGITPNTALGLNWGSDAGGAAGDVGIGTTSDAILPQPHGRGWEMFSPDSGSPGIPRSQMPQIKGEHREAFIRFLADRGIRSQPGEIKGSSLKPMQADYSPTMVARFMRPGPIGERSVLVSSDGRVLDGHHQWMASRSTGASASVIHLGAPKDRIRQAIIAANRHVRRDEQSSFGVAGAEPAFSRNAHFSRLSDSEVQALVAQYADVDGAPSEAALRDAVKQFRDTERAYGGRDAWQRAHDAGRTKLNYGQWVQVRTPNFKEWFGDWEAAAGRQVLRAGEPTEITGHELGEFPVSGLPKEQIKTMRASARTYALANVVGIYTNNRTGQALEVRKSGVDSSVSHGSGPDKLRVFAAIPDILTDGVVVFDGANPKNAEGRLVAVAKQTSIGGRLFMVTAGFREDSNGRLFYDHELTRIENAEGLSSESGVTESNSPVPASARLNDLTKRFMAQADDASKAIDPGTGEPLVVYHGTDAVFHEFDPDKSGSGASSAINRSRLGAGAFGEVAKTLYKTRACSPSRALRRGRFAHR